MAQFTAQLCHLRSTAVVKAYLTLSRIASLRLLTSTRQDEGDRTVWELPTPKIRWLLIGGVLWLAAWLTGLYGAVFALGLGHRGHGWLDLFLFAWLSLWVVSGAIVLILVLWGYFGRERITLGPEQLTIERLIFGRGKRTVLERADISNFRFRPVRTDYFGANSKWSVLGIGAGKVSLTHRGRGYSFGLGLPDEEAQSLSDELERSIITT